jgi:hypothetical protein
MTEIDAEENLAGNDVAAVRLVLDQADGADRVGRVLAGDGVDALDHARGADQRIFAQRHRRRAGVRCLPDDGDFVPAHALHALHRADHAAFGFEDRALLDVQLEHRGKFARAGFFLALVADARQLIAKSLAVAVGAPIGVVGRKHAGKDAGCEHSRREARAFFVGPIDDLDRRIGLVAGLVERAHGFQRAEDAERAVEFAAGRLGVEMRAHGDRRKILVLARAAREHGADFVDRDSAAERLALRLEPVAHLAVEIGQRQAANTTFRRRADLCGVHQRVPKPLAVDLQVLHVRKLRLPVAGQGPIFPGIHP